MHVRVLFFGVLRDLSGKQSEEIELPEGALVRDLIVRYESENRRLKESFASIALAVNQQYSGVDAKLHDGDEIALLPPVSGGSVDARGDESKNPEKHATIIRSRIDTKQVLEGLKCDDDGAAVVFEGVVRNQTRGRKTRYLEYEAYEEMALHQMESLAAESLLKFQVRDVAIVHRLGHLEIGEISVLIVVASAHRGPAFDACRWLIDTLKRKVPIWKKEFFEDGAVWADGEPFPDEIPRVKL